MELPLSSGEGRRALGGRLVNSSRVLLIGPHALLTACVLLISSSGRLPVQCLAHDLTGNRPDEPDQFACHRRTSVYALLASSDEVPIATTQAKLCFPGDALRLLGMRHIEFLLLTGNWGCYSGDGSSFAWRGQSIDEDA